MIQFRVIFLFILSCTCRVISAQTPPVQSITVADGLSQGFITALYQDQRGFLWIGTLDGLNRYDGYSIRRFNYQPFSRFSLSNSAYITTIQEDTEGLLWIGTDECLYVFDPATERFFNLNNPLQELPRQGVKRIVIDLAGNVLVHMPSKQDSVGLFRMIVPTDFSNQLRYGKQPLAGVHTEKITAPPDIHKPVFLESSIGDTLLLVRDNSGRGYRLTGAASHLTPYDLFQLNTADPSILWNGNTGIYFRRRLSDGRDTLVAPNEWRPMTRLKDGERFFNLGANGTLYKIRSEGPLFSDSIALSDLNPVFQREFESFLDLPYGISVVSVDRSDVLWIGTGGHGLQKINMRNLAFRHVLPGTSLYNLRQMPDGRIWAGKFQHNKLINLYTGQFEEAPWASLLRRKIIYNVMPDRSGNLWFIVAGNNHGELGSIAFWEKATGRYRELTQVSYFKESIAEQILEDRNGNVWIAAHDGHLYRSDAGGRNFQHFNYADLFSEHDKNLTTNAILEDSEGRLWIGTSRGLLEVRTPEQQGGLAYHLQQHDPDNPQSLSWNWVLCLYQNPAIPHQLWIGTRGGGLNCFDKKTGQFSHYTELDGLADNVVYGIVPDNEGNLWCSTNRGLSRFSPSNGLFVNYDESDGLQNNEFNTGAFLRGRDGNLLFGGVNGLTLFNPDAVKRNSEPPPVAITSIRVRGNLLAPAREGSPLQFSPSFAQTLTLPFSENNVTFEFAALDFANPATNRYRYQMQGIDRDWIYSGTTHSANYASLPPGAYTFQVQAATADGDWNSQGATFQLEILPPWYRSRLAYFLYLLIAAGATWSFIRFREKRLREQHVLQLKQQESERLQELDSFKNRLFANITHEFRTPLTIILGLAERLRRGERQDNIQDSAGNIITQGANLLDLVNQMLDLAKLDSQGLTLHPVQGNLGAFIRYHIESFQSLAVYKDLRLTVAIDPSDLVMDFDPQRFRQILSNLLSNAIRHTPPGGSISVRCSRTEKNQAVLEVADAGEGILPQDLPHIFDRFYQGYSSEQKQGTGGIGLALTRELVLLAGGDIQVSSQPGKGATFTVTLPITNKATPVTNEPGMALPLSGALTTTETSRHSSRQLPLLLVLEDNAVVADYLRLCLNGHYRLLFAADGEKGIQMAYKHIPDVILSDVMMPFKDGLEVTDLLKKDERTSHILIVLLSAKTQIDERLDGLRRGANAYLTKPFNDQELLLVLNNQLEFQRTWKQRYAAFEKGLSEDALASPAVAADTFRTDDEFMKKLYAIFETHYPDEHFDLEQLCRLTGMSSSQLHRKLTALTDQPAMQMLRTFRLNKAHDLLRTRRDLQVAEICMMVGFNHPAHFSRMFSKTFGMPPSAVRNDTNNAY